RPSVPDGRPSIGPSLAGEEGRGFRPAMSSRGILNKRTPSLLIRNPSETQQNASGYCNNPLCPIPSDGRNRTDSIPEAGRWRSNGECTDAKQKPDQKPTWPATTNTEKLPRQGLQATPEDRQLEPVQPF